MTKGQNRKGSDVAHRLAVLANKGIKAKDRGGRNLGVEEEHSRITKGNLTQAKPMKRRG